MGMIKGVRLVNARLFVQERFGAGTWHDLLEGLSPTDASALDAATPAGWYDASLHARLLRALCDHLGAAGDLGLSAELGRFEAERDLTTSQRWFIRLIPPAFAVRNMDIYWSRFHDTGRWQSEVSGSKIVARLAGYCVVEPALCRFLQGYLGRTLEFLGARECLITHPSCRASGHPACEFRTSSGTLDPWAYRSGSPIQSEEMPRVVFELSHLSELDALAEAIVDVLRNRLSFSYVGLWARDDGSGELRLVRSRGTQGVAPHRSFVLQALGRTVGRIDTERSCERDHGDLDQLMACFALSLSRLVLDAPARSQPGSDPPRKSDLSQHVAAAAERWTLTPRQREVLQLLVRGSTNKEIAVALGCQEGTVEVHVSQTLRKSKASNRAELVSRVLSCD